MALKQQQARRESPLWQQGVAGREVQTWQVVRRARGAERRVHKEEEEQAKPWRGAQGRMRHTRRAGMVALVVMHTARWMALRARHSVLPSSPQMEGAWQRERQSPCKKLQGLQMLQ